MKLKIKMSRRQITALVVIGVAICALLISRSGKDEPKRGLDAPASRGCSDFAAGYPAARTKATRLRLADKVMASSRRTENTAIAEGVAQMGRSADDSDADWKASAAALTRTCRDAGWKAP